MRKYFFLGLVLACLQAQAEGLKEVASEPMKTVISTGCVRSGFKAKDAKIQPSEAQWKAYCDCSAGKFVNDLTEDEWEKIGSKEITLENDDMKRKLTKASFSCIDQLVK